MEDMGATVMERDLLKLMRSQDTSEVVMDMEDMDVATVMERDLLKLMRSQDTSEEEMEDMVVMAADMDVVMAMERGRLMPSQDTAVDMDMV